jgi:hypothetical protein
MISFRQPSEWLNSPIAFASSAGAQARLRCGSCLAQEAVVGMPMELDHLIPEALGGRTVEGNLWLARSLW